MREDYIKTLKAKNYGCLNDVSLELTPLHALIGPNDSGKSTILRAVRTLVQFATGTFEKVNGDWRYPFDPAVSGVRGLLLEAGLEHGSGYQLTSSEEGEPLDQPVREATIFGDTKIDPAPRFPIHQGIMKDTGTKGTLGHQLRSVLDGCRLLRFDPDALRQQSALIPDDRDPYLQNDRGLGLPGIYDAIMNRDVGAFLSIQEDLRRLFPTVSRLSLRNVTDSQKALAVQLCSGESIPAEFVSEGMLLYLAFAAVRHVKPTSVLLVEEPENGLHPARIADVVGILREVSKTTQVLVATHSPLVVNELQPEEVSVVTRKPDVGTSVVPIKDTPNFEERSQVYALGELWVSYADGAYEEPLLSKRSQVE